MNYTSLDWLLTINNILEERRKRIMGNGWYAKLTLVVKGPQEGPVTVGAEYDDTTKEVAVGLQNLLLTAGLEANKKGKL